MHLCCSQLSVVFRSGPAPVAALRDLSFDVRDGEFLTLVGPSGCGKTTLLRVLAGILAPTSGSVERAPRTSDSSDRVLLVSQENSLFPWMTALDNAAFGLSMQGVAKREREMRALELLGRLGLAGRERAWPHELSAGMKQRVAVARCFLSGPAVLLMDEPFGALDDQTRARLQRQLLDLWEADRKTVVFVTHAVDEAILLSDRILVLSEAPARVVAEYQVPFARPRDAELLSSREALQLKRDISGSLDLAGGLPVALCV